MDSAVYDKSSLEPSAQVSYKTPLTLAITFEPLEIETLYLACILNWLNSFKWHQGQWLSDIELDRRHFDLQGATWDSPRSQMYLVLILILMKSLFSLNCTSFIK